MCEPLEKVHCRQAGAWMCHSVRPPVPSGGAVNTQQGSCTGRREAFYFLVFFGLSFCAHIYCLKTNI